MKYLLVPIRDIQEQGWLKVSDLYKAWLCCHRGITYSADLSGKDGQSRMSGCRGWGSLFGPGVPLPGKPLDQHPLAAVSLEDVPLVDVYCPGKIPDLTFS